MGRGLEVRVHVASGPERTGRAVGWFWRMYWWEVVGRDMSVSVVFGIGEGELVSIEGCVKVGGGLEDNTFLYFVDIFALGKRRRRRNYIPTFCLLYKHFVRAGRR